MPLHEQLLFNISYLPSNNIFQLVGRIMKRIKNVRVQETLHFVNTPIACHYLSEFLLPLYFETYLGKPTIVWSLSLLPLSLSSNSLINPHAAPVTSAPTTIPPKIKPASDLACELLPFVDPEYTIKRNVLKRTNYGAR